MFIFSFDTVQGGSPLPEQGSAIIICIVSVIIRIIAIVSTMIISALL